MLKGALIGLGGMGQGHLQQFERLMAEGEDFTITALCDIDEEKLKGKATAINIDLGDSQNDRTAYRLYTDMDTLLETEKDLDFAAVVLPTYLHAEAAIKALNKGLHVLCEKPMALRSKDCDAMAAAANQNGKKLMIAQCLRFWPEYEILKEYVESEKLGKVLAGYFFRGGGTPRWSYQNWYLTKEKSGGALLDQHIHDVDMINWLFGKPESVSSSAIVGIKGSGYDIVSTNYHYPDGKVICAQDDWMLNGDFPFDMRYRVTFEKGNILFEKGSLQINPDGEKGFTPDYPKEMGYYREQQYFIRCLLEDLPVDICPPESTADTIRIAEAEMRSADAAGQRTAVE